MNKEYTCVNGNVIVKDENGNQRPVEYSSNLDEILVQENLIEEMKKRLKVLKCSSNQFAKYKLGDSVPILLVMVGVTFAFLLPVSLLYKITVNGDLLTQGISTLLSNMSLTGIAFLGVSTILTVMNHMNFKKYKRGNESELEFLEKRMVLEKDKLEKLKQKKKSKEETESFKVEKVNDLEELKKLRRELELFYDLGINEKKYYKYYQNEELDKKLGKQYTNEELYLIEDYFEKNGPVLVKKR